MTRTHLFRRENHLKGILMDKKKDGKLERRDVTIYHEDSY